MKRTFISNLVLMLFLNVVIKPVAIFGIDANVQNRVGTEDYGLYFSLLNLSYLLVIVMDLGINNYTTTQIARYPKSVSKYLSKVFSFRLILFLFYASLTLALGVGFGYKGEQLLLLLVLIFNQLLVTLISYFRSHFSGLHFFKIDAVFSILDRLLLIAICGALLLYTSEQSPFQLEWFVWSQTAAYGITFLAAFATLIQKIGMPKFRLQWMFSLAILKKSYPYALLVVLMTLYTRMDAVLLERWHPDGAFQAGIYAQGYRLLDAVFMFGMIFAGLLLPIFSRLLKTNPSGINEIMQTSRNVLVGGALLLASIVTFNAEYLLSLIYTNDTQLSSPTFVWLMWSFVAMAFSLLYGTLLTAKGDLRYLNQLALIGIVLNLVFNALLIPIYGATGSAFATFITQVFTALFQTIHCHRKLPILFSLSDFFRLVLFIFLLLLIGWLLKGTNTTLYIQLTVGVLLLFVLKLVHHKDILSVLSSKEEELLD